MSRSDTTYHPDVSKRKFDKTTKVKLFDEVLGLQADLEECRTQIRDLMQQASELRGENRGLKEAFELARPLAAVNDLARPLGRHPEGLSFKEPPTEDHFNTTGPAALASAEADTPDESEPAGNRVVHGFAPSSITWTERYGQIHGDAPIVRPDVDLNVDPK